MHRIAAVMSGFPRVDSVELMRPLTARTAFALRLAWLHNRVQRQAEREGRWTSNTPIETSVFSDS